MAQVYSRQLGKVIDVSDDEYQKTLSSAGTPPSPPTGEQPPTTQISQSSVQTPTDTTTKSVNPLGLSLQDLYQAKSKAQAAGDKPYISYYQGLIDTEEGFAESSAVDTLKDPFAAQKKSALQSLQLLENRYSRGNIENIGKEGDLSLAGKGGLLSRTGAKIQAVGSKTVTGKLEQDINKYKNILDTFRGTFTQAFGSGTPQEAEALAFIEAAPSETSTNEEAIAWFDDVRSLLKSEVMPSLGETAQGLPEEPPDLDEDDAGFLEKNIVRPHQRNIRNIALLGQVATARILEHVDPQLAAQVASKNIKFGLDEGTLDQAARLSGTTGEKAGALLEQVLDSANIYTQGKILQGLGVNVDLGQLTRGKIINPNRGTGLIGKIGKPKVKLPDLGEKAVKVGEKIERATPKSFLGRKQAEAASKLKNVKIDTKSLLETGKKAASKDPDIAREFAKQKPFINKVKDVPQLLDRMQSWGKTTYLKSGGVKAAAKADLYDDLYRVGTQQLKTVAPEVYKYRSLLRFSFELPRSAGKWLWRATLGRATLGGF